MGRPVRPSPDGPPAGRIAGGAPGRVRRRRRARAHRGAARAPRARRRVGARSGTRSWPASRGQENLSEVVRALDLPAHRGLRGRRPVPRRRVPAAGASWPSGPRSRSTSSSRGAPSASTTTWPPHLFAVAAGLESAVLGRVRGARPGPPGLGAPPASEHTCGPVLAGLFREAVAGGPAGPGRDGHRPRGHLLRPRRGGPGRRPPGRWARRPDGEPCSGAGEIGGGLLQALVDAPAGARARRDVLVASRTSGPGQGPRPARSAARLGLDRATSRPLPEALGASDVVFCALDVAGPGHLGPSAPRRRRPRRPPAPRRRPRRPAQRRARRGGRCPGCVLLGMDELTDAVARVDRGARGPRSRPSLDDRRRGARPLPGAESGAGAQRR